jgi:predicted nucleotide-binding protein
MGVDPLRLALEKRYSKRHLNRLIAARASERFLTRRLAMLSVARDAGLNWIKYAAEDEIATLRGSDLAGATRAAAATPSPTLPRRRPTPVAGGTAETAKPRRGHSRDRVFVVHGRNLTVRSAMFAFLRAVGLNPIEWGEWLKATGKPMPYVAETLEKALAGVAAVVVLLTPDDEVVLKARFQTDDDPEEEKKLTGQARPNVLFEGGMAFARHPEKTVFVIVGKVKQFSDVGGMHTVRLDNSATKRSLFVDRLRATGADVQIDGRTDWFAAGDFKIEEDGK